MNKKLSRLRLFLTILFFAYFITSCSDSDNDIVQINTLAEGIYEITYAPAADAPYTETVYLKQDGNIITGEICTGFIPNIDWDAPTLYGAAEGNAVVIKGGGVAIINNNLEFDSIKTTLDLFEFWPEAFDFLKLGVPIELGVPGDFGSPNERSVSFHNSFFDCTEPTPDYFNGCDFPLHMYKGTITVNTLVPNMSGSFTAENFPDEAIYSAHKPSILLTGSISGTFNVPFDGSPGTFAVTGTVDGMEISANVANAQIFTRYTIGGIIDNDGLLSGNYDVDYYEWSENGTFTTVYASDTTGCPVD